MCLNLFNFVAYLTCFGLQNGSKTRQKSLCFVRGFVPDNGFGVKHKALLCRLDDFFVKFRESGLFGILKTAAVRSQLEMIVGRSFCPKIPTPPEPLYFALTVSNIRFKLIIKMAV
jgi:hypothetical protein